MKIAVFPMPNGMPDKIGTIQGTGGKHVHENHNWPTGDKIAAIQTTLTMASGGGLPVAGSFLCAIIILRMKGSRPRVIKQPTAMPRKERPVIPLDQCRWVPKMIG